MTRDGWATKFLTHIGAPVQQSTKRALVAWMQTEGSNADWNPFATTQRMPGSTNFNSIGVQNYVSSKQGIEATWKTLNFSGHRYGKIRRRLRNGDTARKILEAVAESDWGTEGELLLRVLEDVQRDYDKVANKQVAS
jgi:hypothetical protein